MKKTLKVLFVCILVLFGLTACASSANSKSESMGMTYDQAVNSGFSSSLSYGNVASDKLSDTVTETAEAVEQKIITNVHLDVETKEFDKTIDMINKAVEEYGGYVQSSSLDDHSYYSTYSTRYGRYTVRIPADKVNDFVSDTKNAGNVTSIEKSTEDITTSYYDTKSHLEALHAQEDRLLELYKKADTIEDLIKLENRLSELRYQIDSNETLIKNYDLLTTYSTVSIYVEEVKILTETEDSFFSELKMVIKDSTHDFIDFAKSVLFTSIYMLPYALIALVVIIPAKKFIPKGRRIKIRRWRKNQENSQKQNENK